jgi:hypothetical protein
VRIKTFRHGVRLLPAVALLALAPTSAGTAHAEEKAAVTFNKNFEGGALGKIERLGDA